MSAMPSLGLNYSPTSASSAPPTAATQTDAPDAGRSARRVVNGGPP
jgi:hypothetical protein